MDIKLLSRNEQDTIEIGRKIAKHFPSGSTILLLGDLGAGKTTLVRGIARGLNIQEKVQSPTFNIMKLYLTGNKPLVHIDAYRLDDCNHDIGLEEYIGIENGLTVIEWPMFIKELIPENSMQISIISCGNDVREITISNISEEIKEVFR